MIGKEESPTAAVTICFTAFSIACLSFVAAAVCFVPIAASACQACDAPAMLTQVVVLAVLFGTPIVGAVAGIDLGARIARI